MSARFFTSGLVLAAAVASGNGDDIATLKAMLIRPVSDVGMKLITAATNATPIACTSASHGYSVDDLIVIGGVLGNLAANGTFLIKTVADANTFTLKTLDGVDVVGSGAYTSGGWCINLTKADFIDDLSAGRVGTDQTLGSITTTGGAVDCTDPSWSAVADPAAGVTGDVVAVIYYKDSGSEATSPCVAMNDGRIRVVCAANAAISATSIAVEKLDGPIPSGTVLVFSNGASATLSGAASEGDRTLTVSALAAAITAGHAADAVTTSALLPVHPNGGSITLQVDSGVKKLMAFTQP